MRAKSKIIVLQAKGNLCCNWLREWSVRLWKKKIQKVTKAFLALKSSKNLAKDLILEMV